MKLQIHSESQSAAELYKLSISGSKNLSKATNFDFSASLLDELKNFTYNEKESNDKYNELEDKLNSWLDNILPQNKQEIKNNTVKEKDSGSNSNNSEIKPNTNNIEKSVAAAKEKSSEEENKTKLSQNDNKENNLTSGQSNSAGPKENIIDETQRNNLNKKIEKELSNIKLSDIKEKKPAQTSAKSENSVNPDTKPGFKENNDNIGRNVKISSTGTKSESAASTATSKQPAETGKMAEQAAELGKHDNSTIRINRINSSGSNNQSQQELNSTTPVAVNNSTQQDSSQQKSFNNKQNTDNLIENLKNKLNLKEDIKNAKEFKEAAEAKTSKTDNAVNASKIKKYKAFAKIKLSDFTNKTSRLIQKMPNGSTTKARLVLTPKSLGTVFVEITMNNNKASIVIRAQTQDALKSIEKQLAGLKEKLGSQGIQTENIEISLSKNDSGASGGGGNAERGPGSESGKEKREFIESFRNLPDNDSDEIEEVSGESAKPVSGGGLIEEYV